MNPDMNILVPLYLCASYLYYIEGVSVISDSDYDLICKKLHELYDDIDHQHKYLVDKDALLAGTGFHINWTEAPLIIIGSARHWWRHREDDGHWKKVMSKIREQG